MATEKFQILDDERIHIGNYELTSSGAAIDDFGNEVFTGTLKVADATDHEIATVTFSQENTLLTFPDGAKDIIKCPRDNKKSVVFFSENGGGLKEEIAVAFAFIITAYKDKRDIIADKLKWFCEAPLQNQLATTIPLPQEKPIIFAEQYTRKKYPGPEFSLN